MNQDRENETLGNSIRGKLDASLDRIDAATQARITRARYRALEQQQKAVPDWTWWRPVAAVVTVCSVVVLVSLLAIPAGRDIEPVENFELLSNMDDLEFIEELEFYEWLDEYELPT